MPQIRVNLDNKADKKLRIYMAKYDIPSKEKTVIEIIKKLKV